MKLKSQKLSPLFFSLSAIFLSFTIMAQDVDNLVNNPGFEKADSKKLRKTGDIERAEGWTSATPAKADLFSSDSKMPDVMTPNNIYGSEAPKEGSNYAGVIAYSFREKEARTYLQTQLKTPLKKDMRYKVQFYVSLAELSRYSSNRLGAYFSKKPIGSDKKTSAVTMSETHVEHPEKEMFTGTFGWDLICGEYVASGGEKFLTIGNFSSENDIRTDRVSKPRNMPGTQIIAAYYYIDDVSVRLLEPNEKCDCSYGQSFDEEPSTVYQRSPEIRKNMSVDEILQQYNIYFAQGRYDIRVDGQKTLEAIVDLMKENPNLKIQITGHTDSDEAQSPENKVMSARRSEYTKTTLIEMGIDEKRVFSDDAKNNRPSEHISDDDDDRLRAAKSRRVSFKSL